jgi:hypothetical protein
MIILLLLLSAGLQAQFYSYGQDAGQLRWSQYKSPHYTVIFPRDLDSLALAFTRRLESYYPFLGAALDHEHSHMPVIIHNESSFSNGVFVWAPKRLEIFSNPDPGGYNQDWLTQLALHEGRHAVQIDKLNQGFSRGLYFLGGEQLVGAMAIFLPYWYLEGDAVDAETRLSKSGRGRLPSFEMGLKAQMLEADRVWSFSKAVLGSYRSYIPNHYELGYQLVRHGRRQYGDEFWIDFQNSAARRPFLLNPTFFSMRKYGLRSKKQFYLEAMEDRRRHWQQMDEQRELIPRISWNEASRHYTSYRYPHPVSENMLFTYKSGMDQIPEFILQGKKGEEQLLFRPGYLSSGRVSFSGAHVVWDEFVPDLRWSNRNYSVICTYELATGNVRRLGGRTRYYAPAVSSDGQKIAVIEQSDRQDFSLVVLSLEGEVEWKVPSPGNVFIQHPTWMEEDSALVVIRSLNDEKSLLSYHPGSRSWKEFFRAGVHHIADPVVHGNKVYFSGTFSGIDNIYCADLRTGECHQLSSERFGAFHPQLSSGGSVLYYSAYSASGYKVAALLMEDALWKPLQEDMNPGEQEDAKSTDLEKDMINTARESLETDSVQYPRSAYSKLRHLFNVHSWLPFYVDYLNPEVHFDPEDLPISLGLSLISQNHLSTAVSQIGYEYKDGFHMFHSGIQLKGRYPVLNLYFDYGGEPQILLLNEAADTAMSLPQDVGISASTYVPLRLNTGKFLTLVQPGISYDYKRDLQYIEEEGRYREGAHYLYYSMYATSYMRMGQRDILPRLGLTLEGGYYHAPFDNRVYGAVSSYGTRIYLPGLWKHHSIRLRLQHQVQHPLDPGRPAFINLMSMPRGRQRIFGEVLTKTSADYVLPLLYPDLELTALLYVKRIRAALWGDYLQGKNMVVLDPSPHYEDRAYGTLGVDLIADLNVLRVPFPLSVGGRYIYETDTGKSSFDLIFAIDID